MLTAEYDYATDIAVQREEAAREAAKETWEKAKEASEKAVKEAWQKAEKETWQKVEKATWQKALQNARNLKNLGIPLELISQGVGLSIEEIENL